MEGKLFWSLDDDVLSGGVPANHVVVLWPLKQAERKDELGGRRTRRVGMTYA